MVPGDPIMPGPLLRSELNIGSLTVCGAADDHSPAPARGSAADLVERCTATMS